MVILSPSRCAIRKKNGEETATDRRRIELPPQLYAALQQQAKQRGINTTAYAVMLLWDGLRPRSGSDRTNDQEPERSTTTVHDAPR